MLLAGGVVMPRLLSSCKEAAAAKNIGLQLYSLRDMVKESGIQAVLETVAKMGYKNLETASSDNSKIYGLPPSEFKK
ncbi:MAG: sugar phosphate isomerase/epimerase, partial [Tannerella sp.]|nr:sugar phosphate isomerase/epimerase [Tannerella sp.]